MKLRYLMLAATALPATFASAESGSQLQSLDGVDVKGLIVRVPVSADGQVNYDAAEYRVDAGSQVNAGSDLTRAFAESPDAVAMGEVSREAAPVPQTNAKSDTEQYPYYNSYGYYPYYYNYYYNRPYNNYSGYNFRFNVGYNYYYNSPGLHYYNNSYSRPYYYRYYYFGRR